MKIPHDCYVIIIGGMKCGTSSLYSYLVQHPSICPCIVKEPEFFSENQGHGFDTEKYEDLWEFDIISHRYAIEASTGYTKYPDEPNVPEKIYKYGIEPKFIYIVRDPFERIISHYNYMRNTLGFDLNVSLASEHFINVSNYFLQLEEYYNFFSKKNFLVLRFDELKKNPKKIFNKTMDFLGISKDVPPISYSIQNKTISLSKTELLFRSYPNFNKITNFLPNRMKTIGKKVIKEISKPEEKRQLSKQEKEIIFNRLKNDMERFFEEYGFNPLNQ